MKHRKYINQSFGYKGQNPKIDGVSDSYKYGRSVGYVYCDCEIDKDHEIEAQPKRIRFYTEEGWSEWQSMDKMKIPEDMLKVETHEQMTLKELKKYPDLYKKAIKELDL